MRNENSLRLKKVIESDRMSLTAESNELILRDLESVLSDYFHLTEKPTLFIGVKNGEYKVEVKFSADALKTFAKVPS